jgi:hypothetical protein
MKLIERIARGVFTISTNGVSDSSLELNFNPIIEQFKLTGKFYLVHWQARPKGHREFGVYNSITDSYISTETLPKLAYGGMQLLQLNDVTANVLPSAVIYFTGSLTI